MDPMQETGLIWQPITVVKPSERGAYVGNGIFRAEGGYAYFDPEMWEQTEVMSPPVRKQVVHQSPEMMALLERVAGDADATAKAAAAATAQDAAEKARYAEEKKRVDHERQIFMERGARSLELHELQYTEAKKQTEALTAIADVLKRHAARNLA